jgi:hypothetical protein
VPRRSPKAAKQVLHNCVTFDDGRGHKWHVPFEEAGSVPRVGEEVLLPNPRRADERHSVVSVKYHFVQREVPEGTTAIPVRKADKSMYVRLFNVTIKIR